jgi:phosphatidylinositol alpha-1,6-mannosyltransferase
MHQEWDVSGVTLLLSENFPPKTGGSGRWFWEVYRRLPRESFLVAAGEDPRQEEFDRTHDLRVVRLPLTLRSWGLLDLEGLRGYRRAVARLRRLARDERVAAVHCGRCLPEGVMALALRLRAGIPYACYAHGEDLATAAESREHRWLARRVLHRASFLIANSRNTEQILREQYRVPASRVRVLHPGVDVERFTPADRDPEARGRLGWGDRPVVLTVGRLQLRKGHDRMIRALSAIRDAIPDVLYAIVGDGEELPALRSLAEREGLAGHVQFLGEIDDRALIGCYQQCDLFVLPNRQVGADIEGFGMVLLEAQACGRPVVAGASGGTAETMAIPETGRVVPCDEPGPLAAAVVELLSDRDRLARMGAAARRLMAERFDWAGLSRQAEQLFREGMRPRPAEVARCR